MPWKIIEGPKVSKLTRALAKEFASMPGCKGDREERDWRKVSIKERIRDNQFRAPEWASAFCKEDGIEYRVNGKHTSTTLAEMNGEMPKDMYVFVTRFECETLHDVAELYNTFDSRISVRSTGDVVRSYAHSHETLAPISSRLLQAAVTGMSYAEWEDNYSQVKTDKRAELMFPNVSFCLFVRDICGPKEGKILRRAGVVAAMFRTFQKSQADSKIFWTAVRDGSGNPASTPDRQLNKYLLSTSSGTGRGSKTGKNLAGVHEFYVRCLQAWNAWRKNEPVTLRYRIDTKTPAVI